VQEEFVSLGLVVHKSTIKQTKETTTQFMKPLLLR